MLPILFAFQISLVATPTFSSTPSVNSLPLPHNPLPMVHQNVNFTLTYFATTDEDQTSFLAHSGKPFTTREYWRDKNALWNKLTYRAARPPLLIDSVTHQRRYGIRDLDAYCDQFTLGLKRYLDRIWPWETNDKYVMQVKFTHKPDFESPYYEGQFADFHFIYARGQSQHEVLVKLIEQFESWIGATVDINLDQRHVGNRFR